MELRIFVTPENMVEVDLEEGQPKDPIAAHIGIARSARNDEDVEDPLKQPVYPVQSSSPFTS